MRSFLLGALSIAALGIGVVTAPGCGSDEEDGSGGSSGSSGGGEAGCVGFGCPNPTDAGQCRSPLECSQQENAQCEGGTKTTLTGIVYDPAGVVPIYNATVYIPLSNEEPLDPIVEGAATCDRCDAKISGKPIAITTTGTDGSFKLDNAPSGANIPLVIQIGKWRRKVIVPAAEKCASNTVDKALSRLPKNSTEGHIPRMALATGAADPLQCLLRKVGIDDSEFGIAGSAARIHLYAGGGFGAAGSPTKTPTNKFKASVNGGAAFPAASTVWDSLPELQKYDVVLLSCEGDENIASKPDPSKKAVYDYAAGGGRVFASHYHYSWFSKSPDPLVSGVANWSPIDVGTGFNEREPPANGNPATTPVDGDISDKFPKAVALREWLTKQNALPGGKLPIFDARHNIDTTKPPTSLSWITVPTTKAGITAPNNTPTQYMTFNTPIGAAEDKVCGRVVVSDIHVAAQAGATDSALADFPDGCVTTDLTAQQKALEFMLFDLSSCIQKDDAPIQGPK